MKALSPEAVSSLVAHGWPGNVRELENVLARAYLLSEGEAITVSDLSLPVDESACTADSFHAQKARAVRDFERDYLQTIMRTYRGNISRAARAANKNRRAFWELLRSMVYSARSLHKERERHPK